MESEIICCFVGSGWSVTVDGCTHKPGFACRTCFLHCEWSGCVTNRIFCSLFRWLLWKEMMETDADTEDPEK